MRLSDVFIGVAAKWLSTVEIDPASSNQHEFNGTTPLKEIFGLERLSFQAMLSFVSDEHIFQDYSNFTWYDSRENHPVRSEHRLYFKRNVVTDLASEGDLLLVLKKKNGEISFIIADGSSDLCSQILWLFNFDDNFSGFRSASDSVLESDRGKFLTEFIFREAGVDISAEIDSEEAYLRMILDKFGEKFPSTFLFSQFAAEVFPFQNAHEDADNALLHWMEKEEFLFKVLENFQVRKKLDLGFSGVDDFISYSLSIQNRRKSRAGLALENHLEVLFQEIKLPYSRGKQTENRAKPDFIFPGIAEYHSQGFSSGNLNMLAVKTSCKDRWRQALTEANRIPNKHLITLQPAISDHQLDEMQAHSLQLVVPKAIHETYSSQGQHWLWSLDQFIGHIQSTL